MNTDKHGSEDTKFNELLYRGRRRLVILSVSICVYLWLVFFTACASKPTDMRSLVPADSLVYLETNDLGAAVGAIVGHEAFRGVKGKPDVSALNGIQLAITVSGFDLKEEKLTGEHSIARVQPTFVAVADTHAWNWQAVAFAEYKIGEFVMDIYRSDVTQARSEKHGGHYFSWGAADGRRAHAVVIGSIVYLSNNEQALEKCLSVTRGEVESIAAAGKVQGTESKALASGYVLPDGVSQISNIVGLLSAGEIGEAAEIQSLIAGILPQLIRDAVSEIRWSSERPKDEKGAGRIEDKYSITSPETVARVFAETLAPSGIGDRSLFDSIPANIASVTHYDLAKPNTAWRGILLTSGNLTDRSAGSLVAEFADSFTEPYAIRDPELYLSGVAPAIVTGNVDPIADKPFVISTITDPQKVRDSLTADLRPDGSLTDEFSTEVLRSEDGDLAAALYEGKVISGDADAVITCLRARASGNVLGKSPAIVDVFLTGATASSLQVNREIGPAIAASIFGDEAARSVKIDSVYVTETRFSRSGIERRTLSDFGLVGAIIAQLGQD